MGRRSASILLLLPVAALGRNLQRFRILLRGPPSRPGLTPSIATGGFLFGIFLVGGSRGRQLRDDPHGRQARPGVGSPWAHRMNARRRRGGAHL